VLALLLVAQAVSSDATLLAAVERAKLEWSTCAQVYGKAAAMTDRSITPSDAAGAALGHCAPQEDATRAAADAYTQHNYDVVNQAIANLRQKMREFAMAAVVDYRMAHSKNQR
jgi:hypothetical protein